MDSKSGPKPVFAILSLEESPIDAEMIYEFLCENSSGEIQMHTVPKIQKLVTRHAGRMWAESKIGEGAAFHFVLMKRKNGESL